MAIGVAVGATAAVMAVAVVVVVKRRLASVRARPRALVYTTGKTGETFDAGVVYDLQSRREPPSEDADAAVPGAVLDL